MSLKELVDISKKYGPECEEEIRKWIVSSVCSLGTQASVDNMLLNDDVDREQYLTYARKDCHRDIGQAIINGGLSSETITSPFRNVTAYTYTVLLIKPAKKEKVADTGSMG